MNIKQKIFSGIQSTGILTIGNYLGVIKNWVRMQYKHDCMFCIADLHSLSSSSNYTELYININYNMALYVAAGINPNNAVIFQQSKISEHCELAWILNCFAYTGWLDRMTQFKNKNKQYKKNNNVALYLYPILMAADILLYNVKIIPVGEDQSQHIELVKNIATAFNKKTKTKILLSPKITIDTKAKRIMSLKNPYQKMSKSDLLDISRINLSDNKNLIKEKIQKAKTDSFPNIIFNKVIRPGISNLINMYSCLVDISIYEIEVNFKFMKHSEFKKNLINIIIKIIHPLHCKAIKITSNKKYLEKITRIGTLRAKIIARQNIEIIKNIIGFF